MKKILFLLLSTVAMYGQVPADATPLENIQITNNTQSTTATKVNVQENNGTINTISKSDLVNVVEVNDVPSLPLVGEVGKIYVVKNVNKIYRWNGTFYQELAGSDISGKEDIANKQNSLAVDGTGVKFPTVDAVRTHTTDLNNPHAVTKAQVGLSNVDNTSDLNKPISTTTQTAFNNINKKLYYVTPEDYGAVGDGVTDDKTAIQNAVNSGKPVNLAKKRYFISGTIDLPEGTIIKGTGTGSLTNIKITANAPAFAVKGNNVNIDGVSFIGNHSWVSGSYTTANPNQHGIAVIGTADFVTDYERILISNCTFYQMSGGGIYITYNIGGVLAGTYSGGVQATNCVAYACYVGYYADERGEYNAFVNCKAYRCAIGFRAAGGNNMFTGGILNSNNTGAYLTGGANNGHGTLSSTALNHNVQYGLWTNGVTIGYNISDCQIYTNDIYFQNSIGIDISGGGISVNSIYAHASSKIAFTNVSFTTTPANLYFNYNGTDNTGVLSDVNFFNPKWWVTVPSSIVSNQLDNGLFVTGTIKNFMLAGTGTRLVTASPTGELGTTSIPDSRPYKVYTALLTQSGTNAPVATVLENTLGGTVVWSYVSIGQYRGTLTGAFLSNKTVVFLTNVYGKYFLTGGRENDNSVMIGTQAPNGGSTNGDLSNSSIEIRVYL